MRKRAARSSIRRRSMLTVRARTCCLCDNQGAIQNFTAGLTKCLRKRASVPMRSRQAQSGRRSFPPTMPDEAVRDFGEQVPMQRPGQPAELATTYA